MAKMKWSKGSFMYWLNSVLNKNHPWFDYVDTVRGFSNMEKDAAKVGLTLDEPESFYDAEHTIGSNGNILSSIGNSLTGVFESLPELINSLVAHYARNELTGAEREQNAFNAGEAQLSRDFTEYMARNKYSMETQSMQDAGVNPAMVYGGGNLVPTAANGATGQGHALAGGDMLGALTALMRLPTELAEMRAAAEKSESEGKAAIMNAESNRITAESAARNAGTNEGMLGVQQRQAAVAEARVQIEQMLADNNTRKTDAEISNMAATEAYTKEMTAYISKNYEVAMKNADASQKHAIAAIMSAKAAQENAAAYSKLTDSQALLNGVLQQKEAVYRDYLPAQLSAQVDEMKARGYYFNQEGKLVDKQGKLVDAQIVREYVGVATEVARTACQVAGTVATGGLAGASVQSTPSSAPSYSSYGDLAEGIAGVYGD